jgi:hypothetical protein
MSREVQSRFLYVNPLFIAELHRYADAAELQQICDDFADAERTAAAKLDFLEQFASEQADVDAAQRTYVTIWERRKAHEARKIELLQMSPLELRAAAIRAAELQQDERNRVQKAKHFEKRVAQFSFSDADLTTPPLVKGPRS